MAEYFATIHWERNEAVFTDKKYQRRHTWKFDGGTEISASSSPHVVPVPLSDPSGIDPEEAFVASISSCHMLWFLSIACQQEYVVESYHDEAVGDMTRNDAGQLAITLVTLRPRVIFSGANQPDIESVKGIHRNAHDLCFIANSVKTEIRCEPQWT